MELNARKFTLTNPHTFGDEVTEIRSCARVPEPLGHKQRVNSHYHTGRINLRA